MRQWCSETLTGFWVLSADIDEPYIDLLILLDPQDVTSFILRWK